MADGSCVWSPGPAAQRPGLVRAVEWNGEQSAKDVAYDAAGNQTQLGLLPGGLTASYDAEGRQTKVEVSGTAVASYEYDADGRRVKRTGNGPAPYYVYDDAEGQLMAEYGGTAAESGTLHVVTDQLGSTRVLLDAQGNCKQRIGYAPFGAEVTRNGQSCYGTAASGMPLFTSKERDAETGLDYFGARYMSGAQGRWTSPDLINLTWDRLGNPSNTLNKYVYAANNPLKFTDPDGQDITLFYRPSASSGDVNDYGHVFMAAYDQSTSQAEFLDYYPKGDLQSQGLEMVGPGAVNTGTFDERRTGFASLTVQTTPEVTQKVMEFMRKFKANPADYRFPSNTCATACRAALEIAGIRVSAYSPSGLWNALYRRYSLSYRMLLFDGK